MKVFVITHDQGVDGGRAIEVRATVEGAISYVEDMLPQYPGMKRVEGQLCWDSLGDSFFIDEFEVGE